MKILQIFLIALTAFSECNKKNTIAMQYNNTTGNIKTMAAANKLKYLALGDSYTIGESVQQSQSYPYQFVKALNIQSFDVQQPTIIATTGWTTDDLIGAIAKSGINTNKYDFVTLLIGVNDQYQHLSQENYRTNFVQLLNTAIAFANGNADHVFVLSVPDWGVTPFANGQGGIISPQIDQFNAINKAASLKAGVNYIDITPISRQAPTDPSLIAGDGLHPSGKMYKEWVKLLEPMVAARLKK